MKLTLDRAAFATALDIASACTGRDRALPQLGLIHIVSDQKGLFLYATDMDRSVRSFCPTDDPPPEIDLYVEGALLSQIVGKLRGPTLDLELKNGKLELRGGTTKLNTASPTSYPNIILCETADDYHLGFKPGVFTEFGKNLLLGTSVDEKDEQKAYRNIIQIRAAGDTAVGRSTDLVRIAQITAPCSATQDIELLIPLYALRTLFLKTTAGDEQLRLGQDDNHIFAVYGTTLYAFRKTTTSFPDLERQYFAVRKFDRAACTVTTASLNESLELANMVVARAVAQGARPAITWLTCDEGLRMTVANVAGEVDELVETSVEGEHLKAIYGINQILPIISQCDAEEIRLEFAEDKSLPGLANFPLRIRYDGVVQALFDLQSLSDRSS